jgi:hypothetical protein
MSEVTVSFPFDVWHKAKSKEDLQAWISTVHPDLDVEPEHGEEELIRYKLDFIHFPKKKLSILLEFSDEADDNEIIALIPQRGFFATGDTAVKAETNLLRSIERDYFRLRNQRDRFGQHLLSRLEFLEQLF